MSLPHIPAVPCFGGEAQIQAVALPLGRLPFSFVVPILEEDM